MEDIQKQCPCCENHCTSDALQCGRGRRYFQEGQERKESPAHAHEHRGKHHHDMGAMDTDEKLAKLMRHCGHILWHQSGNKQGQRRILSLLEKQGVMTQKELQKELDIQSGSLSEVLGKLEKKGWIERRQNEADKRNVDVMITKRGEEEIQVQSMDRQKSPQELFHCLDEEEKVALVKILDKLIHVWKEDGRSHKHHHKHIEDKDV